MSNASAKLRISPRSSYFSIIFSLNVRARKGEPLSVPYRGALPNDLLPSQKCPQSPRISTFLA
mgnify:CR=1 FL=1